MTTLVKDTHRLVEFLQTKGYSKEQAQGFVEAANQFEIEQITKDDLKVSIQELRADMYKYIFGIAVAQTTLTVALVQLLV